MELVIACTEGGDEGARSGGHTLGEATYQYTVSTSSHLVHLLVSPLVALVTTPWLLSVLFELQCGCEGDVGA